MFHRTTTAAAFIASCFVSLVDPAAADGETQITHAKALAGNVTPGDTAGYPVIISIPGTFELASNLFVAAGKIGIQVTGANVTIDMNGFTMEGSNVAFHGVVGAVENVTVRNGTIINFEFDGIHAAGSFWTVEDMKVLRNGRVGIVSPPPAEGLRVLSSTVSRNDASGISCGSTCHVEGNTVSANGALGIGLSSGTVLGNTIMLNVGLGISQGNGGYGNNTLLANNSSGTQISGTFFEMHPNACNPPSNCPAAAPP